MLVPILTYHAANIAGNDYATNDHVAFSADLALIHELGLRIVPVQDVVDRLLGRTQTDLTGCVALTCDDGTALDYYDLDYPLHGPQRSFFNLMREFREREGVAAQPTMQLTCFVIADPLARERMDATAFSAAGWMGDAWWQPASASRQIAIGNHSWDHNHACLADPGPHALARGSFLHVVNDAQAEFEITQAQVFLAAKLAPATPTLFCYPYGHVNEFLRDDWLPRRGPQIGLDAAFGDGAQPAHPDSDRWNLPRYICGWHWKSSDELRRILQRAR